MKIRFLLSATGTLLIAASANAQTDVSSKLMPVPGAIKDGGVYDVASSTWSSNLSASAATADAIYDNTCMVGSFLSLNAGESVVDSGRLPSTSSPDDLLSETGSADSYELQYFKLAYCTSEPTADLVVNFYQCYDACSDATLLVPDYTYNITGAPGSASGSLECWSITIDLGTMPELQTMLADCDGAYDNVRSLDLFGWSFEQTTAPANGAYGPLVAGDPFGILGGGTGGAGCAWGEGTTFGGGTEGTGIGTDDLFELDAGGAMLGCSYFGGYFFGNEYSSTYLEIGAGEAAPVPAGIKFCFGDGSGTACPCTNDNDGSVAGGQSGCANGSSAGGASMDVSGSDSIGADDLVFSVSGLPVNQPGLFFQGENAVNSGLGNPFGDGLRCAGGNVFRLGVRVSDASGLAASNGISISTGGGAAASDVRRYQFWYRDPNGSPCATGFNLTNGVEVVWQP